MAPKGGRSVARKSGPHGPGGSWTSAHGFRAQRGSQGLRDHVSSGSDVARAPARGDSRATVRWSVGTTVFAPRGRGHERADPARVAAGLGRRGAARGDASAPAGSSRRAGAATRSAPSAPHPQVRRASRHPAADAVHVTRRRRPLRDRGPSAPVADAAPGTAGDHRLGLRVGEPPGLVRVARLHDRGEARACGAGGVDQRPGRPARELPAAPAPGGPDAALGEPARWPGATRLRTQVQAHPRAVPGSGADRHPRARRPHLRPQRRLRRGVVPAPGPRHPRRLREARLVLQLLPAPVPARTPVGSGARRLRVPERPARDHPVVPRPHARDDPTQRVRRSGGVLPAPPRPGRPAERRAARTCPASRRPPGDVLLRDPAGHPGPLLPRRRLAVLPEEPEVLRRLRRALPAARRRAADLEPGVLRRRHGRQRPHLAPPVGRTAALPLPGAERLRLPVPRPEDRLAPDDPAGRDRVVDLDDRRRGRLPAPPGAARPGADRPGRAGGRDRGLHRAEAGDGAVPREPRTGRAVPWADRAAGAVRRPAQRPAR